MSEIAAAPPAAPAPPTMPPRRQHQRAGMEGLLVASWVFAMLGTAITMVGIVLTGVEAAADVDGASLGARLGVPAAVVGGVMLLGALSVAAYRSIVLRRDLGEDRYRGPSILILLAIVVVAGTLATVPFIGSFVSALEGRGEISSPETFLLLASTSTALLVTSFVFVGLPRALPRVRLLPERPAEALRDAVLGIMIGAPAWILSVVIALVVSSILGAVLGTEPDQQLVLEVIPQLHPVPAVLLLVVLAPVAEEIFFRGIVINAWLREYGPWRAVIGSSLLFALIHASLFALVPIFLLALVLGWVYLRTRSLVTAIAIHATYNGIVVLLLLLRLTPAT